MTVDPVSELESRTIRKLFLRLLPFLFLLYIVAYLDRINVSFAALQMRGQLHLTDRMYGRAAEMFSPDIFSFSSRAIWYWTGLGYANRSQVSWWSGAWFPAAQFLSAGR